MDTVFILLHGVLQIVAGIEELFVRHIDQLVTP